MGKTYAMIEAAHQRLSEGIDVAAGYVETHGRAETDLLLQDLEVIPRRQLEYRGTVQTEMDLDAVLARKPQLVLVDELAHTNVPGSRHTKRYQDVDELLAAGIDVYTTVNIQHLESLNDVVAQITGVTVRETIPDRIMDTVDNIELVDLPPEELIRRLHEGKVYVPDRAARAVQQFFRPGNLTALREMALRHTAAQVDGDMRAYKKAHSIFHTWAATDRLLVCIIANPLSERLATGRRLRLNDVGGSCSTSRHGTRLSGGARPGGADVPGRGTGCQDGDCPGHLPIDLVRARHNVQDLWASHREARAGNLARIGGRPAHHTAARLFTSSARPATRLLRRLWDRTRLAAVPLRSAWWQW